MKKARNNIQREKWRNTEVKQPQKEEKPKFFIHNIKSKENATYQNKEEIPQSIRDSELATRYEYFEGIKWKQNHHTEIQTELELEGDIRSEPTRRLLLPDPPIRLPFLRAFARFSVRQSAQY